MDHGDYYDVDEYLRITSTYPGQLHTPDEQCKLLYGDESGSCGKVSDISLSKNVQVLKRNLRIYMYLPPLTGKATIIFGKTVDL